MNYLIQRGKVRAQVINVPEGLPELLSDITREVLRCQPTTECLCQFIMDYLHSVIVTREKARVAQAIIERALRTVDEVIADLCICDITKVKAEEMAKTMEECFKRFLESRRCEVRREKEIIKFEDEDMLDELIRRCKFSEHELKVSRPAIEEAYHRFVQAYMSATEGTDGTEALYMYLKERELKRKEEGKRHSAAVLIQANFRGWQVRRKMFSDLTPAMVYTPIEMMEREAAARKIQRFYRQHSVVGTEKGGTDIPKLPGEICTPVSVLSLEPEPQKEEAPEKMLAEEIPAEGEDQRGVDEGEIEVEGGGATEVAADEQSVKEPVEEAPTNEQIAEEPSTKVQPAEEVVAEEQPAPVPEEIETKEEEAEEQQPLSEVEPAPTAEE